MTDNDLLDLFQRLGVVTNGHFVLSSGRHSDEYWEKFRLLEWPCVTEQLCRSIATCYKDRAIEAVVGPTTGGALLAQEVARQLGEIRALPPEEIGLQTANNFYRFFSLHEKPNSI